VAIDVVWLSITKSTCKFNLTGAVTGTRSVQVMNVDGAVGTLGAAFTVN
jgi:hypothetical protein